MLGVSGGETPSFGCECLHQRSMNAFNALHGNFVYVGSDIIKNSVTPPYRLSNSKQVSAWLNFNRLKEIKENYSGILSVE